MGRTIWTYYEGDWHEGNTPILGAADHGTWLGSLVFDGARAFEGGAPGPRPALRAGERIGAADGAQSAVYRRGGHGSGA